MLKHIPLLNTLRTHTRQDYVADGLAGLIVAIMLVPQGMAYAVLAGLPPQHGLYASLLPLLIYGFLGTSRYLAIGPVAIVSLLTSAAVGSIVPIGTPDYIGLVLTLALMVAVIQTLMGILRIGFLVNFLSHPVLVGFSAAAAILIGLSQIKSVLGVKVPRTDYFYTDVIALLQRIGDVNWVSLVIGVVSVGVLLYFKLRSAADLRRLQISEKFVVPLSKLGPLLVVGIAGILTSVFRLDQTWGIAIVGEVPRGLPSLTMPNSSPVLLRQLLPTALAIGFVGYMESISVAKSLAARKREQVDANQELLALGIANFGAAFTGGYPVTGGFSRSLVNHAAGARSPLASIVTACLLAIAVVYLTPLFVYIPMAALAANILIAITGLVDVHSLKHIWQYDKRDSLALVTCFLAVLGFGVESGILVGAALSVFLVIWRTSQPHMAVLGKLPNGDFYRNVERHQVQTWPDVAILRIDASLYFANTAYLKQCIADAISRQPALKHLVLVGTAINDVDYSALEALDAILDELAEVDIRLHLAAFKGPVLDKLTQSGFMQRLAPHSNHLTTHAAIQQLGYV